jgi:hypothetical protein
MPEVAAQVIKRFALFDKECHPSNVGRNNAQYKVGGNGRQKARH